MSYQADPLMKAVKIVCRTWPQLGMVFLFAFALASLAWALMPNSYEGRGTLNVKLTEDLFKQTSAVFYNPLEAESYFKMKGAAPEVLALIPLRLGKLNSKIVPVYAYDISRSIASTQPNQTPNYIIQLEIEVSGPSVTHAGSALKLMGDFVRNSIMMYRLGRFMVNKNGVARKAILDSQNSNLDLGFEEKTALKEKQSLKQEIANCRLPQAFTWSIPEKEESQKFLPPQVRLVGVENSLRVIAGKREINSRKIAENEYYLAFLNTIREADSGKTFDEYLKAFQYSLGKTFANKDNDEVAEYAKNNLRKILDAMILEAHSIHFISKPMAESRPANLKLKAAGCMLLWVTVLFLGVVVVVRWDKFKRHVDLG